MISHRSYLIFGLLLLNMIVLVQPAPLGNPEFPKKASADTVKPSRNLIDDLVKKVNKRETSAENRDNTVESKLFADINMNPKELRNLARKRRNSRSHVQLQRRNKRSLSKYEFYNTNPFYESLFAPQPLVRPARAFAPLYWYPSSYTRQIRSDFEPSEWNLVYPNTIENDDDDDQIPYFINDEENDYEYNRFPFFFDSSDIPYDNLQLQQEYNTDDVPMDDEDNDDELFSSRYDLLEPYFN